MVETVIITIIKSGSIAFFGTKIVKALGQKEISEIIAGSGYALIFAETVKLLLPVIKGIQKAFESIEKFFDKMDKMMEALKHIPLVGKMIEAGMVN